MSPLQWFAAIVGLALIACAFYSARDIYRTSREPVRVTFRPVKVPDIQPGCYGFAHMGTVYVTTVQDSGPAVAVKRQEKVAA